MKINILKYVCLLLVLTATNNACKQQKKVKIDDVNILHNNQLQLTEVIIYDVFTPPVASRIYAYSSLAAYEAIRFNDPTSESITNKLHGFATMPLPQKDKPYNYLLASSTAFFKVVHNVRVFSVDSLKNYEENLFGAFKQQLPQEVYDRSVAFGDSIASLILARAKTDGYAISRGKKKYLGSNEPGKWRPTPPDYLDGVEWCWNTMKPMLLDSAAQFILPRPPAFSTDTTSIFYKGVKEVYDISKTLTEEQKLIARYWDDNPFVIEHSGHLMFGNKKITPGGHWMGITSIAAKKSNANAVVTAKSYALTAIALYDAFIACWDEKYRSNVVRPVTVINDLMEKGWSPFLQTPPFPEYTSGHSTITAAAATVLTKLYGNNFAFTDTSDLRYIGLQRDFTSFEAAANEASVSRLYGGIHYRLSTTLGAEQGKKVGELIIKKIINP